ncbi:unnamed protein product [Caenorhabditis sp. 36 PRJEB53466]|nr:unnamed protein product [Caenorhabditis sp. 36 PRJEB53466]
MSAINNLDALFSNLSKGRVNLSCNASMESGYEEIASHCDRTAVFHAFGAYLLRGHTLFTILFLSASIVIFVITVTYHIKVRRQHDIIHNELRTQSPHQRRERLFHTLILSIVTFFLSVMGQTYIEIAVFWVNEREDIAQLSKWYHVARILAFIDPVMNPLIVVLRTPALRRQLRSQWTTIRSRASSRTRSAHSNRDRREASLKRKRSSVRLKKETELMMSLMPTDRPVSYSTRFYFTTFSCFICCWEKMISISVFLLLLQGTLACFPTSQRSYQYGAPTQQFASAQQPVAPQPVAAVARVAAAGKTPTQTIAVQGSSIESLLGQKVSLTEFTADGYNAEGGGPVRSGNALTCNFDGRPCCWANVPPPDDQLDWQIANGVPVQLQNRGVPQPEGSYLIAYAKSAAPSDEAQFASCSIGCASSDIVVRAKHWQSESVLLQVCLRESFPTNAERNPLINCQEFPYVDGMGTTEVILPKTSLVDIVFVASNFIGEQGDVAILDDIEVSYDRNGSECQNEFEEGADEEDTQESANSVDKEDAAAAELAAKNKRRELFEKTQPEGRVVSASERFGSKGFRGGEKAFGGAAGSKFGGTFETEANGNAAVGTAHTEETVFASVKTAKLPSGHAIAKGAKTADFSEIVCNATKCDFESENTCGYKDAHTTQSIRGLTTKFNVVTGQFMNRVTGVKESTEGEFYAATFLFPREMAGLEAAVEPFTEQSRIRFHYYEGTHGVQLKGCCSTIENCPFSSDKFVTVADRAWKTASFKCPKGTDKVIFICENTRTNQGACAVDGIGLVENEGPLKTAKPLC